MNPIRYDYLSRYFSYTGKRSLPSFNSNFINFNTTSSLIKNFKIDKIIKTKLLYDDTEYL